LHRRDTSSKLTYDRFSSYFGDHRYLSSLTFIASAHRGLGDVVGPTDIDPGLPASRQGEGCDGSNRLHFLFEMVRKHLELVFSW
jgi:hypothetical protein